ncbi:MAG: alpha/beta hydrolase [Rhodobacteraceae bacterium]|nr:alpha/beta hydrolase [Paracoccaceae bacterium]
MEDAPFFDDVADAPAGAICRWLTAADGVRLRAAIWRGGDKGTVFLFPGRTEYIEKYGPAAGELSARGYAMATLDWRGQGLAERLLPDPAPGHISRFRDYQKDVAALLAFVSAEDLPKPYYLLAHSMGGCIGLRSLHEGCGARAAVFSAPMWGIGMTPALRPVAISLGFMAPRIGMGHKLVPGTKPKTYVLDAPFEGNVLTRDPAMYAFMQRQLTQHPELAIGGPTLRWLHEALSETRALAALPSPACPALTVLGRLERVVDTAAIHRRMARWPGGRLDLVDGAEHEVIMEGTDIRARFFDAAAAHFDANR